jgi:hypothetical protein
VDVPYKCQKWPLDGKIQKFPAICASANMHDLIHTRLASALSFCEENKFQSLFEMFAQLISTGKSTSLDSVAIDILENSGSVRSLLVASASCPDYTVSFICST